MGNKFKAIEGRDITPILNVNKSQAIICAMVKKSISTRPMSKRKNAALMYL